MFISFIVLLWDISETTITRSLTVPLACRDSLARTPGSPACSTVDFNMDWPVCEILTHADTTALRHTAKLSGSLEVSYIRLSRGKRAMQWNT